MDPYTTKIISSAIDLFNKTPYAWQAEVGSGILRGVDSNSSIRYLCVRPTGGGKTLLFAATAASLKGITLCILPLISLGADQTIKLIDSTQSSAAFITAFHLDEVPINHHQILLHKLQEGDYSKTIVLFSSPQALLNTNLPILQYLLSESSLLSMLVMDEIHLSCHFGKTIRSEFMALKGAVFDKISPSIPQLFLTAMCTRSIKDSFESMLGIHINHVHWQAPQYMVNRNVQFNIIYSTQWFLSITKSIEQYVTSTDPLPKKVIIYFNQ